MDSNFPPTDWKDLHHALYDWKHWQDPEIIPKQCKCNKLIKILISIVEELNDEDNDLFHKIIDLQELLISE